MKFWYHHPKIAAESAVELLSTSDGKLYCRVGNGKYEPRGEVHAGDLLEAWPNTSLAIVNFVPHAQRELIFTPVKPSSRRQARHFEAAAQVELTVGGTTRKLWLQRGDQGGMPIPVRTGRRDRHRHLRLRKPPPGLLAQPEEVHPRREPRRHGRRLVRQHRPRSGQSQKLRPQPDHLDE